MCPPNAQSHRLRYEVILFSDAGRWLSPTHGSGLVEFNLNNQVGYIPPSDGVEGMLIGVKDCILPTDRGMNSVLEHAGQFYGVDILYAGQSNGVSKLTATSGAGAGTDPPQTFQGRLLSSCVKSTCHHREPPPEHPFLTYDDYHCPTPLQRGIYVPNHNLDKITLRFVDETGATLILLSNSPAFRTSRWVIHLVFQYLLKKT